MAHRAWVVVIGDREHRVEIEHRYWSGRRRLSVDGATVTIPDDELPVLLDAGSVHPFAIDGVPCAVVIASNGLTFSFDLVVDGVSRTTGRRASMAKRPPLLGARSRVVVLTLVSASFAAIALLGGAIAVDCARTLLSRPDAPLPIALGDSSQIADGAWVTLEPLELDCSEPAIQLGPDSFYRLAGRDDEGVPLFIMNRTGSCADRSGTISNDARGTHGEALPRRVGAGRVRVLWTYGGPSNERVGVAVGGAFLVLGSLIAIAAA